MKGLTILCLGILLIAIGISIINTQFPLGCVLCAIGGGFVGSGFAQHKNGN